MTAIDTSDENNELGLLFGEEKKMDETMPTSVINSLRETAAEIRNGNQQVSDNGVPRLVRSKRMALAISTEPRDVLQRVSDGVLKLREKLLTREKNNKGATNKSVAEFERYFDDEKVIIDADITILDGALVVLSGESKEKARLLLNYEDERRKVDDMTEAFVKAVDGTRFTDVLELRNNFDTLSERLKERDERDANILNGTDFESIEQMAKNVRTVRSESNDTRLREVVTVALSDLGLKDMVEVVEEVNELRDKNGQMADLIELIMKEVQVLRMNEIIDSIQMSIIERNELEKKFKELKIHFSTAMDMVDKLTIERNEVAAELNEIKKKDASEYHSVNCVSNEGGNGADNFDSQIQRLQMLRRERKPLQFLSHHRTVEQTLPMRGNGDQRGRYQSQVRTFSRWAVMVPVLKIPSLLRLLVLIRRSCRSYFLLMVQRNHGKCSEMVF